MLNGSRIYGKKYSIKCLQKDNYKLRDLYEFCYLGIPKQFEPKEEDQHLGDQLGECIHSQWLEFTCNK